MKLSCINPWEHRCSKYLEEKQRAEDCDDIEDPCEPEQCCSPFARQPVPKDATKRLSRTSSFQSEEDADEDDNEADDEEVDEEYEDRDEDDDQSDDDEESDLNHRPLIPDYSSEQKKCHREFLEKIDDSKSRRCHIHVDDSAEHIFWGNQSPFAFGVHCQKCLAETELHKKCRNWDNLFFAARNILDFRESYLRFDRELQTNKIRLGFRKELDKAIEGLLLQFFAPDFLNLFLEPGRMRLREHQGPTINIWLTVEDGELTLISKHLDRLVVRIGAFGEISALNQLAEVVEKYCEIDEEKLCLLPLDESETEVTTEVRRLVSAPWPMVIPAFQPEPVNLPTFRGPPHTPVSQRLHTLTPKLKLDSDRLHRTWMSLASQSTILRPRDASFLSSHIPHFDCFLPLAHVHNNSTTLKKFQSNLVGKTRIILLVQSQTRRFGFYLPQSLSSGQTVDLEGSFLFSLDQQRTFQRNNQFGDTFISESSTGFFLIGRSIDQYYIQKFEQALLESQIIS